LLTEARCDRAYSAARNGLGPDGWAATESPQRLDGQKRNCNNRRRLARYPVAHNENHALVMAMIEAWRAVDSRFYAQRVPRNALADWARATLPLHIKRTHRWFARNAQSVPDQRGRWISWHHSDGIPEQFIHTEDTSHAELSMRYIGVLHRSIERVNGALFAAGQEPIDVSLMRQQLTNTFLFKVGPGDDLAHNVNGGFSDQARAAFNGTCNGWLDLTGIDARVYGKCREIVLRVVDGAQPNLSVGTHASLLANQPGAFYEARSAQYRTPPAAAAPAGCVIPALGVHDLVYLDTSGRLHELWRDAATRTGTTNLTDAANAPTATGSPHAYVDTSAVLVIVAYRGSDANVHTLYWSTGAVGHDNLTGSVGAPKSAGNPFGYFTPATKTHHVIYRTGNGHLHELWWAGPDPAGHGDLTALASAPPAAGDPTAYADPVRGDNIVVYRSGDGHVRTLYWSTGPVGHDDLSGFAGTPVAAGDPVAYYTAHDDTHQVVYCGRDGHLYELYWPGAAPVSGWDLSAASGAPAAAGTPAAYYSAGTNTKHVVYRSADGRLHEIRWRPGGGTPAHADLTAIAGAPAAADRPAAFTVEGPNTQHAAYRGSDGRIYELRW
jgi:hypothetical protein